MVKELISDGYLGELREAVVLGVNDKLADPNVPLHWRQVAQPRRDELSKIDETPEAQGLRHHHSRQWACISKRCGQWADSVLSALSPDRRNAQLFMVAAWSNKDSTHIREIQKLIADYGIGGLIFFQGGPVRQALLTNRYQKMSSVPLLIGIDGEWGLSMRLDSTIRFPRHPILPVC